MATSGTATFATTRNEIIQHAARLCGALREGESMGAAKIAKFDYALNAMVKHWQGTGLRVWTVDEAVLVPQADQASYTLGSSTTDHVARADDFFTTTLSADEASAQTTLSVTSSSDIAVSDYIGIVVDDGTVHWSTVSSKTSTTVTIASGLDDDAASGAPVFTYTTKLVRPIHIPQDGVRLWNIDGATSTPIRNVERLDFRALSSPEASGRISQVFYDRQLSSGKLTVWQVPDSITDIVKFTYWRPIEDFSAAGDNPDLPQEWILCLGFNLAKIVAPEYGVGEKRYAMVVSQADQYYAQMSSFGQEDGSIFFGVDFNG